MKVISMMERRNQRYLISRWTRNSTSTCCMMTWMKFPKTRWPTELWKNNLDSNRQISSSWRKVSVSSSTRGTLKSMPENQWNLRSLRGLQSKFITSRWTALAKETFHLFSRESLTTSLAKGTNSCIVLDARTSTMLISTQLPISRSLWSLFNKKIENGALTRQVSRCAASLRRDLAQSPKILGQSSKKQSPDPEAPRKPQEKARKVIGVEKVMITPTNSVITIA